MISPCSGPALEDQPAILACLSPIGSLGDFRYFGNSLKSKIIEKSPGKTAEFSGKLSRVTYHDENGELSAGKEEK